MDHLVVKLRNEIRGYFQSSFTKIVDDHYYADVDYRPKYPESLLKITHLHFLKYDDEDIELNYVDDIFTNTEIIVEIPHFQSNAKSDDWIDQIVNFSIRIEFPDTGIIHEDILQWERYELNGERTGRLEIADRDTIDNDICPLPAIEKGAEYALSEVLPNHVDRSEISEIPLEFVENATPTDWEMLGKIRPP